ncbi:MAG: hypothetical protein ACRC6X_09000 [Culicoidibacterales bacterium]
MINNNGIEITIKHINDDTVVKRVVKWHDNISLYEIHMLVNELLGLDESKDVSMTIDGQTITMVEEEVDQKYFVALKTLELKKQELNYLYIAETGNLELLIDIKNLEQEIIEEPLFVEGEGVIDIPTGTAKEEQLDMLVMGEAVRTVFTFYEEIKALEKVQALEDEGELTPEELSFEEQRIIDQTLDAYITFLGFTEEQAAYVVLYNGAIEAIVGTLEENGYKEEEIEKIMGGDISMLDSDYEQVADQLDILASLPKREEILTENDEEKLNRLDEVLERIHQELEQEGKIVDDELLDNPEEIEKLEEEIVRRLQAEFNSLN